MSTTEVAKILGISRIAVFKKIKSGQIKARKIGRNYIIGKNKLLELSGEFLTPRKKKMIEAAVEKTVKEYGEALKLLGQE